MMKEKRIPNQQLLEDLGSLTTKDVKNKYNLSNIEVFNLRKKFNITDYPRKKRKQRTAGHLSTEPIPDEELLKYLRKSRMEIQRLEREYRKLRIAAVLPYLTNSEIGRAFNFSPERARQIRKELNIPYEG